MSFILVVDDEPAIAQSLDLILRHAGYDVAACATRYTAINHAKRISPDLALIDVGLGEENGVMVAMELVRLVPSCQVLLTSGSDEAMPLIGEAAAHGFSFELLLKPITPPELLARIAETLARPCTIA